MGQGQPKFSQTGDECTVVPNLSEGHMPETTSVLDVPSEILALILSYCGPKDFLHVLSSSQQCKDLALMDFASEANRRMAVLQHSRLVCSSHLRASRGVVGITGTQKAVVSNIQKLFITNSKFVGQPVDNTSWQLVMEKPRESCRGLIVIIDSHDDILVLRDFLYKIVSCNLVPVFILVTANIPITQICFSLQTSEWLGKWEILEIPAGHLQPSHFMEIHSFFK
eukprot:TRINITY_DN15518_c0_g1_i1.p1 TRINITY_DN15518_c0_g1~~TRINITY_DN15518_c0_g1_i1.p1  ORF type:complete len:224 (+),score=27.98 TRINITY_DN15518_c0_g1_i1:17-688(+)